MCTPECRFVVKDSPVPVRSIVRLIDVKFASEELDKQVRIIENRQMHYVHSKQAQDCKQLRRETAE